MEVPEEVTIIIKEEHLQKAIDACKTSWSPSVCVFAQAVKEAFGSEEVTHCNSKGFNVWIETSYKSYRTDSPFEISKITSKFDNAFAYPHESKAFASLPQAVKEIKAMLPLTVYATIGSYT